MIDVFKYDMIIPFMEKCQEKKDQSSQNIHFRQSEDDIVYIMFRHHHGYCYVFNIF